MDIAPLVDVRALARQLTAAAGSLVRDGGDVQGSTSRDLNGIADDMSVFVLQRRDLLSDDAIANARMGARALRRIAADPHVALPGGTTSSLADAWKGVASLAGSLDGAEVDPGRDLAEGVHAEQRPSLTAMQQVLDVDRHLDAALGGPATRAAISLLGSSVEGPDGQAVRSATYDDSPWGMARIDELRGQLEGARSGGLRAVAVSDPAYVGYVGRIARSAELTPAARAASHDALAAGADRETSLLANGMRQLGARVALGQLDPRDPRLRDTVLAVRDRVAAVAQLPAVADPVAADRLLDPAGQVRRLDALATLLARLPATGTPAQVQAALAQGIATDSELAAPELLSFRETPKAIDTRPGMHDGFDQLGDLLGRAAAQASTAASFAPHTVADAARPQWPATRAVIERMRVASTSPAPRVQRARDLAAALSDVGATTGAGAHGGAEPPVLGMWVNRELARALDRVLRDDQLSPRVFPGTDIGSLPEADRLQLHDAVAGVSARLTGGAPARLDSQLQSALSNPGRAVSIDMAHSLDGLLALPLDQLEPATSRVVAGVETRMGTLPADARLEPTILAPTMRRLVERAGTQGAPAGANALERAAYRAATRSAGNASLHLQPGDLAAEWLARVAALSTGSLPIDGGSMVSEVQALQDPALRALPAAGRMRGAASSVDAVLARAEGIGHDLSWAPQLAASLTDTSDAMQAARAAHPQLAPLLDTEAVDHELDRSLELLASSRSGAGARESLWPDRGRIGRALVGVRASADVLAAHQAPSTV